MSLRGVKGVVHIDNNYDALPLKHISTFSGERGGETAYYANPIMYNSDELHQMVMWCMDTFGNPYPGAFNVRTLEKKWDYQQSPDYFFWFYEEKYLMMFILRWS